jgi:hypothetical protein
VNLPEPTPEQKARDESLRLKIVAAGEAFAALSPVDRALADVQQRQSWARGEAGIEGGPLPTFNDPASILAAEVVTLRAQIAAAHKRIEALEAEIEWSRS